MGPKILEEGQPVEIIEPEDLFRSVTAPTLREHDFREPEVDFTPRRPAIIETWNGYSRKNAHIEPAQDVVRLIAAGVSVENISDEVLARFNDDVLN